MGPWSRPLVTPKPLEVLWPPKLMKSLVQRVLWLQIPTHSTVGMWLFPEFRKQQSAHNPFLQQCSGLQRALRRRVKSRPSFPTGLALLACSQDTNCEAVSKEGWAPSSYSGPPRVPSE